MQIVGKIRLKLTPLVNHFWNVPLYVTARGLTTSEIPYGERWSDMDPTTPSMRSASAGRSRSRTMSSRSFFSSIGFWPGDERLPKASFYSYASPEPQGFRESTVAPASTYYNAPLGGFYLHYDDQRRAADPEKTLLEFCQTTYEAAAEKGRWDRAALERKRPSGTRAVS